MADRIRTGTLSKDLLDRLYGAVGGTPRFLETVRTMLRDVDPDELLEELTTEETGPITEARVGYYETLFAKRGRLYAGLSTGRRADRRPGYRTGPFGAAHPATAACSAQFQSLCAAVSLEKQGQRPREPLRSHAGPVEDEWEFVVSPRPRSRISLGRFADLRGRSAASGP